jgi:chromosome partitioning protein
MTNKAPVARTIAICTQKGGVGKTTTVSNLAAALGEQGRKVLAVDFDPQFALTRRFAVSPTGSPTLYDVFADGLPVEAIVVSHVLPGVDLAPAARELRSIELSLVGERKREYFLRRALAPMQQLYDFILIDCPPNLGLLTVNALCASDEALVPIDAEDADAMQGAEELIAIVRELAAEGDPIRVGFLFKVRVDRRRQTYRAIACELDELAVEFGLPVAIVEIPDSALFHKSVIVQRPVVAWRPDSVEAHTYRQLADEVFADTGARVG